ncbi:hypothetical protein HDU76_009673 [Blyttiomyces sp. JEL0837]|nr:hypothetical protein HDU76_009673 [Blyttiomyces sp. JEL0837]
MKGIIIALLHSSPYWKQTRTNLGDSGADEMEVFANELRFRLAYEILFGTPGKILLLRIKGLPTHTIIKTIETNKDLNPNELPDYKITMETVKGNSTNFPSTTTTNHVSPSRKVSEQYLSAPVSTLHYAGVNDTKLSSTLANSYTLSIINIAESAVKILKYSINSQPESIALDSLTHITSDIISKVTAILIILSLTTNMTWPTCITQGAIPFEITAIEIICTIMVPLLIDIGYMIWESKRYKYSLDEAVGIWERGKLPWKTYGMMLSCATSCVANFVIVETGLFTHNSCFDR